MQRPVDDFGTDGIVAVGTDMHVTPLEFGVQIKSSSKFERRNNKIIVPRISKEHLLHWSSRFYPMLVVAYDVKKRSGYFEWVPNLICKVDMSAPNDRTDLHIDKSREMTLECWAVIKSELEAFHLEFLSAFYARAEILPIANTFATLLRNLCESATADRSEREGMVLYVTAQAWTHIEVVRQLDLLIPKTAPDSVARRILSRFRSIYFRHCDDIFYQFSEAIQDSGPHWIMMKKPDLSDPILKHLTAMLSDCVCGLLNLGTSKAK